MNIDHTKPYHKIRDMGEEFGFRIREEYLPGEEVSTVVLKTPQRWHKNPLCTLLYRMLFPHDTLIYQDSFERKVPVEPHWSWPFTEINIYQIQKQNLAERIVKSVDELSRGIVYSPADWGVLDALQPLERPDKAYFPDKNITDFFDSPYFHLHYMTYAVADIHENEIRNIADYLKKNKVPFILAESHGII